MKVEAVVGLAVTGSLKIHLVYGITTGIIRRDAIVAAFDDHVCKFRSSQNGIQ
jgi:hypothetical protein